MRMDLAVLGGVVGFALLSMPVFGLSGARERPDPYAPRQQGSLLLGGAADVLDGRIARALGVASRRGAFIDSTLDRFAEFGAFVGLAVWFRFSGIALLLVVTALGGSLLVSYTRARGESVGVLCKLGVMQRAERLLLLGFAGLFDPALSAALGQGGPGALLVPVLGIIAVGTVGTALFRTVWIAQRLPATEGGSRRGGSLSGRRGVGGRYPFTDPHWF